MNEWIDQSEGLIWLLIQEYSWILEWMPRSTPRPPLIGLNSRTFAKFLRLGAKERCSYLCAPSHAVLPPILPTILPPILQHTLSINWNTLQALPKSTALIIERGWITLSLLEADRTPPIGRNYRSNHEYSAWLVNECQAIHSLVNLKLNEWLIHEWLEWRSIFLATLIVVVM